MPKDGIAITDHSSLLPANDKKIESDALQNERQNEQDKAKNNSLKAQPIANNTAKHFLPDLQLVGKETTDTKSISDKLSDKDGKPADKNAESKADETKKILSDGRVQIYDDEGSLVGIEKDGKRWDLKYEGDTLVRYEGKNSYLEYQKNGWQRCTTYGCSAIEGFKVKDENGVEQILTGRVTKQDLSDPSSVKFADIPEIAKTSQRMLDLIRRDEAEGAVKYLAGVLPAMDNEQIKQLELEFNKVSGGKSLKSEIEALRTEGKLSPATAEILTSFLDNSAEKRTPQQSAELAMRALAEPNGRIAVSLMSSVFGGTSEQAIQSRKLFQEMGGEEKIAQTSFSATVNQSAIDIVRDGSINPATLIRDNLGTYGYIVGINEKNIDTIIEQMTPQERTNYLEGKKMAQIIGPLTTEQEKQVAFYNSLHSAMTDASARTENLVSRQRQYELQSTRKLMGWEDIIEHSGKKDLVAKITDCRNDPEAMKTVLNSMSKEQFELLKSDKGYRTRVDQAIVASFNAPDQSWGYHTGVQNQLQRMLSKANYADASRVSADRFFDELGLNYKSPQYVVDLCARGDSDFAISIKGSQTFRERVTKAILNRTEEGSPERALALDSINAIAENRVDTKATALRRTILSGLAAQQSPLEIAAQVRTAMKNYPELKEQLATNQQYKKELTEYLSKALKGNQQSAEKLLSGQGLNIDEVKNLASRQVDYVGVDGNGREKIMSGTRMSKEEAINGLSILESQSNSASIDTLALSSPEEKQVAAAVAGQGKMQSEDLARMFILGINTSRQDLITAYSNLDDLEKHKAEVAYKTKYGSDLIKDAIRKIEDAGDRAALEQALSPRAKTSLGTLSRGLENKANAENVYSAGRYVTETIAGNVFQVADKNAQDGGTTVKLLLNRREKLSPEEKQRLDEALKNVASASKDIRDGKNEAVEKFEQAAMAVGVILSIPVTMGYGGVAYLAGSATIAGLAEAAARKTIKGADYNTSDLIKDGAFIGSGILLDSAPAIAGMLARTAVTDSKNILKVGANATELKTDLEKTVRLAAKDQDTADQALKAIAKKYASEGNEKALYSRLQDGLSDSAKSTFDRAAQNSMIMPAKQTITKPFGQGSVVSVRGENELSRLEGFDRLTGKPIVTKIESNSEVVTAETIKVKASKLDELGYRKVPGTNLYATKDNILFNGRQVGDEFLLSKSHSRMLDRDQILPAYAAKTIIDGTSDAKKLVQLPLSGEDQYRLMTYLNKTEKQGFSALSLAEGNEFSLLLKRVQPGDAIYPQAMKAVSVEDPQILLSRSMINYNSNAIRPGDMSLLEAGYATENRAFLTLKPGAERAAEFSDELVDSIELNSRIYKTKNGSEIVIPENIAKQLDDVRVARQDSEYVGTDKNLLDLKNKANDWLFSHPLAKHPLPEELAKMLNELPNPKRVTSLYLSAEHPEEIYNQLRGTNHIIGGTSQVSSGKVSLYPSMTKNGMSEVMNESYVIYVTNNHEYAHKLQNSMSFEAFQIASERDKKLWLFREYANTNVDEDWAVHFGEVMLDGQATDLMTLCERSPLKALAIANTLKKELEIASNSSPYTKQLIDRISLVEQSTMPQTQKILQNMIRSGDEAEVLKALNYVRSIATADASKIATLTDFDGLLKLTRTTNNDDIIRTSLPLLENWLKNRPGAYHSLIDDLYASGKTNPELVSFYSKQPDVASRVKAATIFSAMPIAPEYFQIALKSFCNGLTGSEKVSVLAGALTKMRADSAAELLRRLKAGRDVDLARAADQISRGIQSRP